jgi:protocatechuate 3,4-dioxygenase, alpha subunit
MMSMITTNQTIGPFFHEGMKWAFAHAVAVNDSITLSGKLFDSNGASVADAMIEMWQPDAMLNDRNSLGVGRVTTDKDGGFLFSLCATAATAADTPLAYVCVFARGLLNHQFSAVFLKDAANTILDQVPVERRATLIARQVSQSHYEWDIQLQGGRETVFFEYQ